jgi:hypothetical protein
MMRADDHQDDDKMYDALKSLDLIINIVIILALGKLMTIPSQ